MTPGSNLGPWYIQAVNLVLLGLTWVLLARLIVSPFLPADNAIARWLRVLTNPVVRPVGAITPRLASTPVVIVFAVAWLFVTRMILSVIGPAL
jgi:uncharacterized protein YggT (Ycf19 family)